ncbi:putative TIM-barrel fold metal-dependent hydrolase [Litoreibacter ponti]|uniref:Putative TIM-barrel fold metal-dependent hydrolase n=1 Tax=Litoreibacter ponti TaxID=1510457 RepID=A0A2T6BDA7_9RHOB|nr:amidohydrolase family protein [Litoreibacter ponti]PTX54012.1 putative TIM-barrel fold metal-dependent hydrolase [Litoreibacter ponti]
MIPTSAPPNTATQPRQKAPAGAVDSHIHMLAAASEFPLWEKRVENPAAGIDMDGFLARYRAQMDTLGISRTVVVHSILYGADNAVTLEAMRRLGPATTRGVALLPDGAHESELDALADAGIKALRLNYIHGGILTWEGAKALAPALAARDMHLQILASANRHIPEIADDIRVLPCPLVVDHMGWPDLTLGTNDPGFQTLCHLLTEGHAYAKLSAPYRVSQPPFTDATPFAAALANANPERCLWGSDWPFIMLGDATMPDAGTLLDRFHEAVEDPSARRLILVDNPTALYGF